MTIVLQGLLGPLICQQLGQQALDNAVTQTAGLLPRDLQALAADAAAAATARGLDTMHMLPELKALQAPSAGKLLQQDPGHDSDSQAQAGPVSIWKAVNGQQGAAQGHSAAAEGQQPTVDGQPDSVEIVEVSEADVQASLDRVRLRTATVIGAPKVSS